MRLVRRPERYSSPAICSLTNWSYGLSSLNDVDQVVAIAVHLGPIDVELEPAGIGVAHEIHPVPRPPLAVVRRRQQPIDQPRPRVRRRVAHERVDLRRRRRQPEHVEIRAADQRCACQPGADGVRPRGFHRRQQKRVDRIAAPRRVRDRRTAPRAWALTNAQ